MKSFVEWAKNQKEKAKAAWTVVLLIGALFGYELTATPMIDESAPPNEHVEARLDKIQELLNVVLDEGIERVKTKDFEIQKSTTSDR